ncbi:MerR family DNA-binding transcriptional regulator [Vagococcus sp.]|uniref:MerR family DNA-binding transcriptional regulator n=1 Tax=Vagococcus sp. TaxID=1933889 RepID=UPI003F95D420
MNEKLKIGDFAKMNDVSVQTLRYYEKIGLLKPYFIDLETNYRYYHLLQSPIIDSIQYLKECNLSLTEIKSFLSEEKSSLVLHQKMEKELQTLIDEQEKISQRMQRIKSFMVNNQTYQQNLKKTAFEIINLPERYLYQFEIPKNIYDLNPNDYEHYLRDFKAHLNQEKLHVIHFSQVGSVIPQALFERNEMISKQMFVFCSSKLKQLNQVKTLPAHLYAVDYCHSFGDEMGKIKELKKKIKANGYHVAGDYLCEVLRELPQIDRLERNMFIRLQIPIES